MTVSSPRSREQEEQPPGLLPDGTPDPAYAAELGLVRAPLGRRLLSFLIEYAIAAVIASIGASVFTLVVLLGDESTPLPERAGFLPLLVLLIVTTVGSLAFVVTQLVLHGRRGMSLGKRITGLRSINIVTLEQPGVGRVLLRSLLVGVSAIVPFGTLLVILSPVWDKSARSRGWHDRVGRLWLVDARRGLDPYDSKAMRLARKRLAAAPAAEAAEVPSLATGAMTSAHFMEVGRSRSSVVGGLAADPFAPEPGPASPPAPADPRRIAPPPSLPGSAGSAASAPPASPPRAPAPAPAVVASPRSAAAAPPAPAVPSAAAPPAAPTARVALVGDDGSVYELSGVVLFGRNPAPRPGETGVLLQRVVDPGSSMSKTHAAIAVDASGVWIEDRGSSNGSSIRRAGGILPAAAGERIMLAEGDAVQMGDRVFQIRVTADSSRAGA